MLLEYKACSIRIREKKRHSFGVEKIIDARSQMLLSANFVFDNGYSYGVHLSTCIIMQHRVLHKCFLL